MKELETNRLKLRKLQAADAAAIFSNWANDPEVTRFLTWNPHESVQVTEAVLAGWLREYGDARTYRWGIEEKETGTLTGMIDVVGWQEDFPVIGYVLGKAWWNQGYMTEACRAVTDYLFAEGFEKILIEADVRNSASRAVIRKTGFIYDYSEKRVLSAAKPEEVTVNCYKMKSNLRRPADR